MEISQFKFRPQNLRNGDLIFWRGDSPGKWMSYLNLVRVATLSDFGHVSIAWPKPEAIQHVEAAQPVIHRTQLPSNAEVFVTPMNLGLCERDMESYFQDKLGKRYSMRDALYGYFGIYSNDLNRWQCAELAEDFCNHHGLSIRGGSTPSRLLHRVMREYGVPLYRLIH